MKVRKDASRDWMVRVGGERGTYKQFTILLMLLLMYLWPLLQIIGVESSFCVAKIKGISLGFVLKRGFYCKAIARVYVCNLL